MRRKEVGALGTLPVLDATGCRAALPRRGHWLSGRSGVIAAARHPEALGRLRDAGATTVSPAQDGPDALEQALADAMSETSPGLVLDCLWGPVTKAYFAALRRSGGNTGANTPHVQIGSSAGLEASLSA
ncbi:hypothetical protein ACFWIK_23300 [Streptomyces anthocyanicus]|uniref:hypothetical protein n=2 Tax=Streptomyces TaxID=1883 RepID=UPI003656D2A0